MPIGIVSDADFDLEKNKVPDVKPAPIKEAEIVDVNRGRGTGSVEVPNSLRNVIGDESQTNGRQSAVELAQSFGISSSSVSAYSKGATSTATYDQRPNAGIIKQARERIAKRARGKLMKALNKITDDKLDSTNAKDLAGIAKDMSAVVRNMEPEQEKGPVNPNNGPTFVFYAPQFRDERHFDVVHAKE